MDIDIQTTIQEQNTDMDGQNTIDENENPNPGIQNIQMLLKKKRKQVKGAEKKYAELSSRPKKVTQKSAKQKCIDIIIKKGGNEVTPALINEVLADQKVAANDYEKAIIQQIVSSRIDLKSLPIAKNLVTKPLIFQILDDLSDTDFYTTDYLYWASIASKKANEDGVIDYVTLKNVVISSKNAMILDEKKEFDEFYIEDFDMKVSSPGWFYEENISEDVNASTTVTPFSVDGNRYIKQTIYPDGQKPCDIYRISTKNLSDAVKIMNDSKKIYSKGVLKSGIKKLTKTAGAYYVQTTIEPTSFCPATLHFYPDNQQGDAFSFKTILNFEVIPEKLIEYIKQRSGDGIPQIITVFFSNMTVEYLASIHDFFSVVELTISTSDPNWSSIKDFNKLCNDNSPCLRAYVKLYKTFEKMVLSFLDSFDIGITIDKLNNVLKNTNEFINEIEFLDQTMCPVFRDKFINLTINLVNCKNFFRTPLKTVALMIKRVVTFILKPTIDAGIENIALDVRALGMELMSLLYDGTNPCIGKIRSPASFMGNVYGEFSITVLHEHLKKIKDDMIKSQRKVEEELKVLKTIKDNYVKKVDDILSYGDSKDNYFTSILKGLKTILNSNDDINIKNEVENLYNNTTRNLKNMFDDNKLSETIDKLLNANFKNMEYEQLINLKNSLSTNDFDDLDDTDKATKAIQKFNELKTYIDSFKKRNKKKLSNESSISTNIGN